jgi:polyisoprenoid-binding protein YceI
MPLPLPLPIPSIGHSGEIGMTSNRLAVLAVSTLFATTLSAWADPSAYTFDPLHTEVRFCWNHLGVSRQCAHFTRYEGELLYDEVDPEKSQLRVAFKTDSIETLVPIFNEHMKGDKLFDAAKYPDATFRSTKFERTGEKTGKVTGDLTVHGVTKPVILDVTLNFSGIQASRRPPLLCRMKFRSKSKLRCSRRADEHRIELLSLR